MIWTEKDYKKGETKVIKAKVCVIGSGCAGAMVAKELARKGVKVVVMEEGPYVPPSELNQKEDYLIPRLYRMNAMQPTHDYSIDVLEGRCIGGGSVINAADCVMTHEEVFKMWQKDFGFEGVEWWEVKQACEAAKKDIRVNKIEPARLNRNNSILFETARKLGYSCDTFEHNREGCVDCGYCMIGCSYNAKQSALITLIPESIQYGAEFYSSAFVRNLVFKNEKAVKAEGIFIDFSTSRGIGRFEVFADVFVLCAGAIHSPNILFHSNHKFPENLGKFLSLQPQLPVMALFDEELISYRGIPQAVYCNQFEEVSERDGYSGFRIESIMVGPAMGSGFLPEIGRKAQAFMKNFHKIAAVLVLFPDKPSGYLKKWNTNQPIIYYEMKDELKNRIKKGLKEATKIFLEAGAKEVLLPFEEIISVKSKEEINKIDNLELKPGLIKSISAHPQGTLRMSMKDGVVDSSFRIKGVNNLYACDSSIFPTTSSSHIMLPIYAFAKLCASRILKNL